MVDAGKFNEGIGKSTLTISDISIKFSNAIYEIQTWMAKITFWEWFIIAIFVTFAVILYYIKRNLKKKLNNY